MLRLRTTDPARPGGVLQARRVDPPGRSTGGCDGPAAAGDARGRPLHGRDRCRESPARRRYRVLDSRRIAGGELQYRLEAEADGRVRQADLRFFKPDPALAAPRHRPFTACCPSFVLTSAPGARRIGPVPRGDVMLMRSPAGEPPRHDGHRLRAPGAESALRRLHPVRGRDGGLPGAVGVHVGFLFVAAIAAIFAAIGTYDVFQTHHSLLRNYPISARIRFCSRRSGPRSASTSSRATPTATPFNRAKRSIVYQRAKGALDKRAVRHPARRLRHGLRVAQPFDRAQGAGAHRRAHHGRRARLPQTLLGVGLQHLGDEASARSVPTRCARSTRAPSSAASRTTPARAATARITRSTTATSSGSSAAVIRLPQPGRARSRPSASPTRRASTR